MKPLLMIIAMCFCTVVNAEDKNFDITDFDNEEELEAFLYEKFPKGSAYKKLHDFMSQDESVKYHNHGKMSKLDNSPIAYTYGKQKSIFPLFLFFSRHWILGVKVDAQNHQIIEITANIGNTGI